MGFTDKAVNAEMMRRHNCHFDKVLENLIANIGRPSSSSCTPGGDSRPTLVSRLLPLRKSDKQSAPSCIEEAVMHLAHEAIFDAGCVVYGGFLRDWVVHGETAGDVDVETSDHDATGQSMSKTLQEFSIYPASPSVTLSSGGRIRTTAGWSTRDRATRSMSTS
jgi:hypothetical protein